MITTRHLRTAASALGGAFLCLAVAVFSSAAWAQAGFIHEISGLVSIQRAGANPVPTKAGDTFESDTIFRTGADAKLIVKFADGQVIALDGDTAVHVERYHYAANDLKQSVSNLELMKGKMRFATGLIGVAHREGVRIIAGDSMFSIQKPGGADFIVAVNPEPREVGYAAVALGEVSARTPYGPIFRIATGQYVPWQPGRAPPLPVPVAAAPAVVQAGVAGLWSTLLPASTPVAVASAAQAAGAIASTSRAQAAASADSKPVGYIEAMANGVSMRSATGGRATASVGTTFTPGTTFNTGADGRVVLKFADGQLVVLGPRSVLDVGQYQFDPSNVKSGSSELHLASGAMRFVSGYIHAENREGISISAGASIIDILGAGPADFTVVVDIKRQEVGVARVTANEISVHTPYGPIDRIKADQSSLWGPKTPTTPIPVATALEVVQAAVALQLSGLPDNTPVAVVASAGAAAAVAEANRAKAAADANPENPRLRAAAQSASQIADSATKTAIVASEAIGATIITATLEALPPTAAGPALAQVAATPAALPVAPVAATVTPGAAGGCAGPSGC